MASAPVQRIYSGKPGLKRFSGFIRKNRFSSVFVVTDKGSARHCYPALKRQLPRHELIVLPAGEAAKQLPACEKIWKTLLRMEADRDTLVINLGGGTVCDAGGFAASVYKRGVAFVNIPTTLLAMADAAMGGKTGIDFAGYKNMVGTFYMPRAVWIDTRWLKTLTKRETTAGFAEIAKHALLADEKKFLKLAQLRDWPLQPDSWIRFSAGVKLRIVRRDPFEKNIRQALNFGHTAGHALESYFLKRRKTLLHGEAVAAGMLCESFISFEREKLNAHSLELITCFIQRHFPLPDLRVAEFSAIVRLMKQDKKNRSGRIRMTLLDGIGRFSTGQQVSENDVIRSLHYLRFVRK